MTALPIHQRGPWGVWGWLTSEPRIFPPRVWWDSVGKTSMAMGTSLCLWPLGTHTLRLVHTLPAAIYQNFLSNFWCSLKACLAFSAFTQVSKCSIFVSHFSLPMLTWSFVLRSQFFPGITTNLFFAVFPSFFSREGGGDFFPTRCLWDETEICS